MASGGAGIAALQNAPIDLSLEVEHMLRLLVPTISRRSSVRTTLPRHLPPVLGNAAQIHQIVLNLVGNASEALPEQGGSIAISTERASLEARSARALDLPPGHYVRLRVADNGRGMSPETRARIFDPFFTTKPKGRGLGLAAVHGIVRSHGGAIRVESAPGAGTTFDIFLPCQEAARAAQG
jgi:signal transduction histidine kinase